jgi:hypothetical protein
MRNVLIAVWFLVGCGAATEQQVGTSTSTLVSSSTTKDNGGDNTTTHTDNDGGRTGGKTLPATQPDLEEGSDQGGYLSGYIVSAFDMEVNGRRYTDSEDFYSSQLQELLDEMDAAGYTGYTFAFNGQLGLDDLKYGMDVYVVAQGKTGFAGDTTVNESGRFTVAIPDGSGDQVFRIRANKRISVTLTSPDKRNIVRWCYNFSSVNTEGSLAEAVLISEFNTSLTRYQCSNEAGSGMALPRNPNAPVEADDTPKAPAPAKKEKGKEKKPAAPAVVASDDEDDDSRDVGGEY